MIKILAVVLIPMMNLTANAIVIEDKSEQNISSRHPATPTEDLIINNITINEAKQAQPIIYISPNITTTTQFDKNTPITQELLRKNSIRESNKKSTYYKDK